MRLSIAVPRVALIARGHGIGHNSHEQVNGRTAYFLLTRMLLLSTMYAAADSGLPADTQQQTSYSAQIASSNNSPHGSTDM